MVGVMETTGIRLFACGGTFDKEYDEINGRLFFKDTHIPEILKLARCKVSVEVSKLMLIDSLEMTDKDREIVIHSCVNAKESRIVITHGTDTMENTAQALGKLNIPKTIVLTGAMIPYAFGSSDGLFNLGGALAFVQALPAGVYIAMNGRFFPWNKVRKNRQSGQFEEI